MHTHSLFRPTCNFDSFLFHLLQARLALVVFAQVSALQSHAAVSLVDVGSEAVVDVLHCQVLTNAF